MRRIHASSPAAAVAATYQRIYCERMADVPIHHTDLSVEAVDFRRWDGHWLGMVVTPWCMSALLLRGQDEGWETPGENQRRFVRLPVGDLAFLGSVEPELGEYQTCALFSPMGQFANQDEAVSAARAALAAMLSEPPTPTATKPKADQPALARRRLFGLRA